MGGRARMAPVPLRFTRATRFSTEWDDAVSAMGRDFRAASFCIAVFMFFAVAHELKTDSGVRIGLAVFKSAM